MKAFKPTGQPNAIFWPADPAGRPAPGAVPIATDQIAFHYAKLNHLLWVPQLNQMLFEYRWDANPPRAARALALVSIAITTPLWPAGAHGTSTGTRVRCILDQKSCRSSRRRTSRRTPPGTRASRGRRPRCSRTCSRGRRRYSRAVRKSWPRADGGAGSITHGITMTLESLAEESLIR